MNKKLKLISPLLFSLIFCGIEIYGQNYGFNYHESRVIVNNNFFCKSKTIKLNSNLKDSSIYYSRDGFPDCGIHSKPFRDSLDIKPQIYLNKRTKDIRIIKTDSIECNKLFDCILNDTIKVFRYDITFKYCNILHPCRVKVTIESSETYSTFLKDQLKKMISIVLYDKFKNHYLYLGFIQFIPDNNDPTLGYDFGYCKFIQL